MSGLSKEDKIKIAKCNVDYKEELRLLLSKAAPYWWVIFVPLFFIEKFVIIYLINKYRKEYAEELI